MKNRIQSAVAIGLSSLAISTPAFADGGTHGHITLSNIIHWLGSPSHLLFTVAGVALGVVLITKIVRKNRA